MYTAICQWWSGFRENNLRKWRGGISIKSENPKARLRGLSLTYYFGLKAKRLILEFSISDEFEGAYQLNIGIPLLFTFYISLDAKRTAFTEKVCGRYGSRTTGFSLCRDFLNLKFHRDDDGWTAGKFNGYQLIKTWKDVFIGDHYVVSSEVGPVGQVIYGDMPKCINYPEGKKNAKFEYSIETSVYGWERFYMKWKRENIIRISMSPCDDFIVPGKGDNDWDQDNETMGMITFGCDIKTPEDAVKLYSAAISQYMAR